ncbi:MAG: DUF4406 domain-containing protein, partial [candidate division Zixibacteria bacterium]|nr:DUF4406 domain-containing protein [candidate division Zixibacteria bacterium]
VAGPLTPRGNRVDTENAAIEYLLNVRDLVSAAVALIHKGYAPFCPGLDMQYFLSLRPGEMISETQIKDLSMAFLEVSDIIVLLPGWEVSEGCQAEYQRAVELGMPSFYGIRSVPGA